MRAPSVMTAAAAAPTPGFTLLAIVLASACGGETGGEGEDQGACVSTEVREFPDGPFAEPDELSPEGSTCVPGGLAEVDLTGRWSLVGPSQFELDMPYIRESCEGGIEIELDRIRDDTLVHRDDTSLFVRTVVETDDFSLVTAVRACAVPDADELAVVFGSCIEFPDEERQCGVGPGLMRRFARPPGEEEAEGLELVSEWQGGDAPWPDRITTNVKVQDGVAFLSRFGELRLIDVANPEEPRDLGVISSEDETGSDFNDVKVFRAGGGSYAVAAGTTCPIIDARDPENPVVIAQLGEYAHSVFVREDTAGRPLAYLATYGPDVPIYDLSDPARPSLVERVPTPMRPDQPDVRVEVHDLFADENRLYLNGTSDGFMVMDRVGDDVSAWTVGGTFPTPYSHASWVEDLGGQLIAIQGDEGQNAHLQVVDVDPTSPSFMSEIGSYQTRPEVSIHNMMLLGTRVYLTYYHDGVRILDLAEPTNPRLVAYYHTWDVETGPPGGFEGAIGLDVDVDAGIIYVADTVRGLLILRETN